MKSGKLARFIAALLFAALAAVPLAAQEQSKERARYRLVDLGTLGGPSSYKSVNAPGFQILNNSGVVSLAADTLTPDPNAPNNCYYADCFVTHAARWQNGVLTDLGALSGVNGSASGAINAHGWIVGQSQNGEIDPATGIPEVRATFWGKNGEVTNIGTFGGNWSLATTLNNRGQVVGFATNAIPDPFAQFLGGTQTRAFIWQNGVMQDLGTLGGSDAEAFYINDRGQVAGTSYTTGTPNDKTGIPTIHPFLWDEGKMIDLGTLGGTYAGPGSCSFAALPCQSPFAEGGLIVNNRGQVVGTSNLAGDQVFHPFLWDRGTLTDLGSLGGDNGTAIWLTDNGEVVGEADLAVNLPGCSGLSCIHHGFLWKQGAMTDLGTIGSDPCSRALMTNSKGQIVGTTIAECGGLSTHAFLWENGGPMIDLNSLIPANSGVFLNEADNINERGEIVVSGLPPGCDDRFACGRIFLLIPCNANDASSCAGSVESAIAPASHRSALPSNNAAASTQDPLTSGGNAASWRARIAHHFSVPGAVTPKN